MMVVVAVAGLIFGCLAWLPRNLALHFHDAYIHDAYIQVGSHYYSSDSPAFWAILSLVLALLGGPSVGFLAAIVCAAKAI